MRRIVSNTTAGLEQRLEKVESQAESIRKMVGDTATKARAHEILEIPVKQLKDMKESIGNSTEDDEVVEKKLGKKRDQVDDLGKIQEEPKESFGKSSESNDSNVWNETASYENALAVDRALNALESDDFPVNLDRQEYIATPLLNPTQSKSEGKFSVCIRLGTICFQLTEDISFLLMASISKLIVLESSKECNNILFH